MFVRIRIKGKIRRCKKMIKEIEQKRIRSQAALIDAIINNTVPDDKDVDYFNGFTEQMNVLRIRLKNLTEQLEQVKIKENKLV